MKFGLDFGTTNSSLSVLTNNETTLLPIDSSAVNKAVVRSALYFYPKQIVFDKTVTESQLQTQTFNIDQISYVGETKTLFGSSAIKKYLEDNKFRKPGVKRKVYTGKTNNMITWTYEDKVFKEDVPEVLEEIDYGTGRLFHALKTALKSPFYKGSTVFGKFYTLEELIGLFVKDLLDKAEKETHEKIEELVVGRPVYFSPDKEKDKAAQDRLESAIKNAGIKKVSFEFEPIGAAKYFLHQNPNIQGKILVFDFGGGTLDTTIIEKNKDHSKVLLTDGVYIGGDLLNSDILVNKLAKYFGSQLTWGDKNLPMPPRFIDALKSWFSIPNLNNIEDMETLNQIRYKCSDEAAIDRLVYLVKTNLGFEIYEAIEKAKKELTTNPEALITYKDGPIDFNEKITKDEFEEIIKPRIEEVRKTVIRTLKRASTNPEEIQAVIATGGSSMLPVAREMLINIFKEEKVHFFELFTSIAAGLVL